MNSTEKSCEEKGRDESCMMCKNRKRGHMQRPGIIIREDLRCLQSDAGGRLWRGGAWLRRDDRACKEGEWGARTHQMDLRRGGECRGG